MAKTAASVLGDVTVAEGVITVVIHHTDRASYSRSVDPLARKAFNDAAHKAGGWSRAHMSADYAHTYDYSRGPHICVSTVTFTRMY